MSAADPHNTLTRENTVILACNSMLTHVKAAQTAMGTEIPVLEAAWELHQQPEQMRLYLQQTLHSLSPAVTTVLAAMGFCGGAWERITVDRQVVIPNLDDCYTMLLQTGDRQIGNLKQPGHLYFRDSDTAERSPRAFLRQLCERYGTEVGTAIFGAYFGEYAHGEMIDTGAYDCWDESFVADVQESADLVRCDLGYVTGSNRILEKLVSGRWDAQFLVFPPGHTIQEADFSLGNGAPRLLY